MALTGLQIFKYLPGGKKEKEANCKKCGFPTCMAFAMKLAKNEITIENCEFASDELKAILEESNQKQQYEIKFGKADSQSVVGDETVMFRHDKKFVNPTCIAIQLSSDDTDFHNKLDRIANYSVERVGQVLKVDAVALVDNSNSSNDLIEKALKIADNNLSLILVSSNVVTLKETLQQIKNIKPLVYLKNGSSDELSEIEKTYNVPVVITGDSIESIVNNSSQLVDKNQNNLAINPSCKEVNSKNLIETLTYFRRSAIEDKFKPLCFPVITFIDEIEEISSDNIDKNIWASVLISKYSNIVILDYFDEALIYSLLTLRQNIFTDPQKPLQIESKIYPVGDVDKNSPVVITTNFALTYFTVVSEIESSGIPVYLLVTPSDGMSVLTAWAANKFTGEIIAKTIKDSGISDLVTHKKLIVPGYVGHLKEEINEELPDWEIIVGTNEAVDIPKFLKEYSVCCH